MVKVFDMIHSQKFSFVIYKGLGTAAFRVGRGTDHHKNHEEPTGSSQWFGVRKSQIEK
jgi:hypothetical protein